MIASPVEAYEASHIDTRPPKLTILAELERKLVLPKDACRLANYTRHYATVVVEARGLVAGVLIQGRSKIVVEASEDSLLDVELGKQDKCRAIGVLYNPTTRRFEKVATIDDEALQRRHLTNRWSARVEDKVSSPYISARGAQLNR